MYALIVCEIMCSRDEQCSTWNDLNETPPQGGWGGQVTLGWMSISSGRSSHVQIISTQSPHPHPTMIS